MENKQITESILETSINESSVDIASTEEMLKSLIDAKYNTSLLYQLCEVLPIKGAYGNVYANKRKFSSQPGFEIVKKSVEPTVKTLSTEYSMEVMQDMVNMFGKTAQTMSNQIIKGVSDTDENLSLMTLLDAECDDRPELVIPTGTNIRDTITMIAARVGHSALEMNHKQYKTLNSFCILPRRYAAFFLGWWQSALGERNEEYLYVGVVGKTEFYVDPRDVTGAAFNTDYNDDYTITAPVPTPPEYCYVGLKDKQHGNSSLVFSPHSYEIKYITDPKTLENKLFVYNRYDVISSPLHIPSEQSSMLHKFQISIA